MLSADEAVRIIETMKPSSMHRLMTELLYGSGLRSMECCTLRLRDLDFDRGQILVRGGKGDKDRAVMMPRTLRGRLGDQCRRVRAQHRRDELRGGGYVPLPDSLRHKTPYAEGDWRWQFVFPSVTIRRGVDGRGYRWFANPSVLDRAIRAATKRAGVCKRVTCHTFRHSLRHTSWRPGTTFVKCRRCSGTPT